MLPFEPSAQPLSLPESPDNLGAAVVSVELVLAGAERDGKTYCNRTPATLSSIFDGSGWENELIWLMVQIMVRKYGRGKVDVKDALEYALKNLDRLEG